MSLERIQLVIKSIYKSFLINATRTSATEIQRNITSRINYVCIASVCFASINIVCL